MSDAAAASYDLTWYGHATWRLRCGGRSIWIDPFLNDNPSSPLKATEVEDCSAVLLTHGHFDHVADAAELAKRFAAPLVANFEIVQWFAAQHGVTDGVGMNLGGRVTVAGMSVKMVPAQHSSSLPDGSYGGLASGFLIETGRGTLYFAGDTCVFSDMGRLAATIDVAVLPIGDLYTMGPADSLEAIRLLQPKVVIPAHYNTWPPIAQDASAWAEDVQSHTSAVPIVPVVGRPIQLA